MGAICVPGCHRQHASPWVGHVLSRKIRIESAHLADGLRNAVSGRLGLGLRLLFRAAAGCRDFADGGSIGGLLPGDRWETHLLQSSIRLRQTGLLFQRTGLLPVWGKLPLRRPR